MIKKIKTSKRNFAIKEIIILISFAVLSYIQVKPYITKNFMLKNWGNIYDINFHITRLVGLNHIFTNPINYSTFGQTGNGTNLFYPWLFYYPANFLGNVFHNYPMGYVFWLILINFVAFLIAFYCGKIFFNSSKAGYLFSVLYVFSNSRIQVGYSLNDLGQFVAITFLPLVFLYWYKIVFKNENSWIGFAISMSLLIYSHVISTILMVIFIIIMSLVWYKKALNKRVVIDYIKAGVLTLFLTSFFWVTLLQQMLLVKIIRPDTFIMQYSVDSLDKCFNSALANNYDYSSSISIGIIGLFTIICSTFLLKNSDKLFKSIYFLALVTLLMSTNLFPWELIQKTPLNIVQFPWRLTEFTCLFLALLLVLILKEISKLNYKNVILLTFLISILGFTSNNLFVQTKMLNRSVIYSNNNDFIKISRQINTKDYYPQKTSSNWVMINPNQWGDIIKPSIINKNFFINKHKVNEKVKYHSTKVLAKLNNNKHKYSLDTPILYYEGTIAKVDGKSASINQSNRGTVLVDIPKNSHELEITNHYTKTAKFAAIISIVSLLNALIFLFKKRY